MESESVELELFEDPESQSELANLMKILYNRNSDAIRMIHDT